MNTTAPHYLLFTDAKHVSDPEPGGRWRFVLEQIGTATRIEEAYFEPGVRGERLQLLAVVRGLEAIEQASRVTLVTSSKYVGRGIRRGLTQWRQNDWQWEHFGIMTTIKNHDLWQRIDHAMQIHQINCRIWQFDPPHVRTQVANALDGTDTQSDESPTTLPLTDQQAARRSQAAASDSLGSDRESIETIAAGRVGNSAKISLRNSRQWNPAHQNPINRVVGLLDNRVKPIGQGRAFGYAVS